MNPLDLNNAYLTYIKNGRQAKERINTNLSAWILDEYKDKKSYSIGQVALERMSNDPLNDNILSVVSEAVKMRAVNQNYESTLKSLLFNNETFRKFYTLKYLGEDSLHSIACRNILEPEVFAYFILKGMRPVFNGFEIDYNRFIFLEEDSN